MSKQMQIFVPQNLSLNEERAKVSWGLILKNRENPRESGYVNGKRTPQRQCELSG